MNRLLFITFSLVFIVRSAQGCSVEADWCNLIYHCCGDLHCYYEGGQGSTGICVNCIERGKSCKRDVQCCGNDLLCQKEGRLHVYGHCDRLKLKGSRCYKDSQCLSRECIDVGLDYYECS